MTINKSEFLFRTGNYFFKIGILLLPSAFFYSSIFLFISFFIANIKNKDLLRDKWNYPLIICSFLMILVCIVSNFNPIILKDFSSNSNLNWVGLLNWIPMFWVYWCAQYYLKDFKGRNSCAFFLVFGTIPILISGFGQYYFEWYGPIKFLNGTIIWYQRMSKNDMQIFTGPFNNPNIAGTWLAIIFPFCLFFFIRSKKISFYKIFYSFLTLATILATFLTHSRNAILNLSIGSFLLMGLSLKIILLLLLIIIILFISIFIFEIPLEFLSSLSQNKILSSFIPTTNKFSEILVFRRLQIWKIAIINIMAKPFLGWGASSFSLVYLIKNGNPTFQHTHNLIFELAHNYGFFVSLILFSSIFLLIYKSKPNLSYNQPTETLINKFWWISSFLILLMHLSDIPYYDGRISLLFWILIAGLRSILREMNSKKIKEI